MDSDAGCLGTDTGRLTISFRDVVGGLECGDLWVECDDDV